MGNYYDCNLTLRPAVDPVATPSGYLYSREAIVSSLLRQKRSIRKRTEAWERRRADAEARRAERAAVELEAARVAAEAAERRGASDGRARRLRAEVGRAAVRELDRMAGRAGADAAAGAGIDAVRGLAGGGAPVRATGAASLASLAAISSTFSAGGEGSALRPLSGALASSSVGEGEGEGGEEGAADPRPDQRTRCPASGEPLRLKDLIPVRFTSLEDAARRGEGDGGASKRARKGPGEDPEGAPRSPTDSIEGQGKGTASAPSSGSMDPPRSAPASARPAASSAPRYVDPLTLDEFTNASRLVLVRPTGDVVSERTWRTCVLPEGAMGGVPVREADGVPLQRGGTGFAAHDAKAEAKKRFLLGPGSGLAGLRGHGPQSKFGLRM